MRLQRKAFSLHSWVMCPHHAPHRLAAVPKHLGVGAACHRFASFSGWGEITWIHASRWYNGNFLFYPTQSNYYVCTPSPKGSS